MGPLELVIILALVLGAIVALFAIRAARKSNRAPAEIPRVAGPVQKRHWLVADEGPLAGKALHIGTRIVTIGRGVSNFIQVNDDKVSRQHAQFSVNPAGEFQIMDLTSRNGTTINGDEFEGTRVIRDQDSIHVGRSHFIYHVTGDFQDNALGARKAADTKVRAATEHLDKDAVDAERAKLE
jgi:predicted component of type VI protein secretion system